MAIAKSVLKSPGELLTNCVKNLNMEIFPDKLLEKFLKKPPRISLNTHLIYYIICGQAIGIISSRLIFQILNNIEI